VATASAPTYFPAYPISHSKDKKDEKIFVDGGVIANNPSFYA
jgi:patatin-like phospholipase/acyl hydrolase